MIIIEKLIILFYESRRMLWTKKIRGLQFQYQLVENDLVKTKKKRGKNMIKFNDIKYERLDYDKTRIMIADLLDKLISCNDFECYIEVVKEIIGIQNYIEEMFDYADIRNMRDSEDVYYKNEIDFWNSNKVKFDSLFLPFYNELNNSRFKEQLINVLPSNFFRIVEYQ